MVLVSKLVKSKSTVE